MRLCKRSIAISIVVFAIVFAIPSYASCPYSDCCFMCSSDAEGYSICDQDTYGTWYNCQNGWRECAEPPYQFCFAYCGSEYCYWT
jgi:hypothetical protein